MRSHLLPSPTVKPTTFNPMDLSLPLDVTQQILASPEPTTCIEWESWGEESTIELCEVRLTFDGVSMSEFISLHFHKITHHVEHSSGVETSTSSSSTKRLNTFDFRVYPSYSA
jgi:hypothetical protein